MNAHRQQAFTLLELLLAIGLSMLLSLLAYGGLHLAIRSWDGSIASCRKASATI